MNNNPKPDQTYQVIGNSPLRPDAVDKVTGRALFGNDVRLPGMLYGAVLRSPHAHARIQSIDTRRVEALPGVLGVVTAADLPSFAEASAYQRYQAENALANHKALYYGHPVAAVAAVNPHVAQEALGLIEVAYEVLPAVLDVREAMKQDAPILLDDLRTHEAGARGEEPSNIASHEQTSCGDIELGFQQAAFIVEREFHTRTVHQGYIEPQNAVAQAHEDGQITIWCSTQGAFGVRDQVAEILQIPVSHVRVIPMEIGGGFGGKNNVYLEPLAALLSRKCGYRPVKMIMGYDEVLAATGPTSASYIKVKVGVTADGRLTAAQAVLCYAAGAYPGSPVTSGMDCIFGPYKIPNVQIDGYDVVVNKPRTSSYRAPGGTNANFAGEVVIDELCEKLGMAPLTFRLLNGVQTGDRKADGMPWPSIGFHEVIRAAQQTPHLKAGLGGPNRGRGIACGTWGNYGGTSSASASVNADGAISLVLGTVDLGTGRTAIAMQLAEAMELPYANIHTVVGDTATVGYTEGTYGSRATFATGWAVYELARSLTGALCERAAQLWDVDPDQVEYARGHFTNRVSAESMSLRELASHMDETGGPVVASASVHPNKEGPAFAVHIADIEVDPETGKVTLLRYTAVQDVGKAIHPASVEGQIHGGIAQGVGWGLNEEYVYDEQGRLLNASLLDYRIPTCLDLPMIETVLVEVPNPGHPYGVRGVGEMPIVPPPAALANAIYRAAGVRLQVLPMSPPRILEALWEKEGK
jgi:xanthine dehydrogenase molybdenum-binding subunit